jgi:hypothetical protein
MGKLAKMQLVRQLLLPLPRGRAVPRARPQVAASRRRAPRVNRLGQQRTQRLHNPERGARRPRPCNH